MFELSSKEISISFISKPYRACLYFCFTPYCKLPALLYQILRIALRNCYFYYSRNTVL